MTTFLLSLFGIIGYFLIYRKTRNFFSPTGIIVLTWFSSAAISDIEILKNSYLQQSWHIGTYAAIFFSGLTVFTIGIAYEKKLNTQNFYLSPSKKYVLAFNIFIALSLLSLFARIYINGFSFDDIIENINNTSDLKNKVSEGIPFLHYFEILTPFLALFAIFEIKKSKNINAARKYFLITYVIYASFFYCLIFSASRGMLLVIFTGALYLGSSTGSISRKNLIFLLASALLVFSSLSFIRLHEDTLTNSFLGDSLSAKLFSPIYTYISFGFNNLNLLVGAETPPTYVFYSLKFILWPFLKSQYESGYINLSEFQTLFFNSKTWIYGFYHDMGILGCILYPALISIFITTIFNVSQRKREYILVMMALQKSILFTFFGNYFFGELVIFFPLIVSFFLARLYQRKTAYSPGGNSPE